MNTWSNPFDSEILEKNLAKLYSKAYCKFSYFDYLIMQDVFIFFEFED
jgi:hypothetical protein